MRDGNSLQTVYEQLQRARVRAQHKIVRVTIEVTAADLFIYLFMYFLISRPNKAYLGHGTKSPVSSTSQHISWLILPLSERPWSDFETAVALL